MLAGRRSQCVARTNSKGAAFLASATQELAVENYKPPKIVQAEADHRRERLVEREKRREGKKAGTKTPPTEGEQSKLKAIADRFLSQSHAENARDPISFARRVWLPRPF